MWSIVNTCIGKFKFVYSHAFYYKTSNTVPMQSEWATCAQT